MELFKRDGKWLTREQLWEYNKNKLPKEVEETKVEIKGEVKEEPKKNKSKRK